jgi:hypothetical protein
MSIPDVVDQAPSGGPTTAMLIRRASPGVRTLPNDLQVETRCGANWCVDGLASADHVLLPAEPDAEALEGLAEPDAWLEQVVRVAWQDERYVSAYVAQSEFSGGAHANNILQCRTFDVRSGRALSLQEVLPPAAADGLLARATRFVDPDPARDGPAPDIDASGFAFVARGFRFAGPPPGPEAVPAIVLCGEGDYPRESGSVLELPIEALPAGEV